MGKNRCLVCLTLRILGSFVSFIFAYKYIPICLCAYMLIQWPIKRLCDIFPYFMCIQMLICNSTTTEDEDKCFGRYSYEPPWGSLAVRFVPFFCGCLVCALT